MSEPTPRQWLDAHQNRELSPAIAGRVDGLSTDAMTAIMGVLGDPHTTFPAVHVTGTNGKGSTAAMIEVLLRAYGLSVGRYSSPHLQVVNERMRRDGEPIADDDLDATLSELRQVLPLAELEGEPSWFELVTAVAYSWFSAVAVDVAVVEVGLLGAFDATNVIDGQVAVVTNIGLDHTDGAPGWRTRVAEEKAAIAGPDSRLVVGEEAEDLHEVFEAAGAGEVWLAGRDFACTRNEVAIGGRIIDVATPAGGYEDVFVPAHGAHQGVNAAVALAAVEAFFDQRVPDDLLADGLAEVDLPGRAEVVARAPMVILDGAHNPDGAAVLAATLSEDFPATAVTVYVVGVLDGRDPAAFVDALDPGPRDVVIATQPPGVRALPAAELAESIVTADREVEVIADAADALGRALALADDDDRVVVCGSLHLVGAVRA